MLVMNRLAEPGAKVVPGIKFLERLVRREPTDPKLRLRFARALMDADLVGDALFEIREVLWRQPENRRARALREEAYDRLPTLRRYRR